jgi:hypothetical protein
MSLSAKIRNIYPQLKAEDFYPFVGTIVLQDDNDGRGPYIKSWENKNFPRPTQGQLDAASEELTVDRSSELLARLNGLGIDVDELKALLNEGGK